MSDINYEEILEKYWGHNSFRGMQRDAIKAIVEDKKDVFFLAPTSLREKCNFSITCVMSRTEQQLLLVL